MCRVATQARHEAGSANWVSLEVKQDRCAIAYTCGYAPSETKVVRALI